MVPQSVFDSVEVYVPVLVFIVILEIIKPSLCLNECHIKQKTDKNTINTFVPLKTKTSI